MTERYHGKTRFDQLRVALDLLEARGCKTLHLEVEGGDNLGLEWTEPGHVWNWLDSKAPDPHDYRVHEDTHIARELILKLGIPLSKVAGLKGASDKASEPGKRRVVKGTR